MEPMVAMLDKPFDYAPGDEHGRFDPWQRHQRLRSRFRCLFSLFNQPLFKTDGRCSSRNRCSHCCLYFRLRRLVQTYADTIEGTMVERFIVPVVKSGEP